MKKTFIPFGLGILIALGAVLPEKSFAQDLKKKSEVAVKDSVPAKKEEKNRNVMLNADSNSGPRAVNIGLPFQDMLILENDVPVTIGYYPQTPIANWRYDSSIGRIGVVSFNENALTNGRIGFAVASSDRDFQMKKSKGFFSAYTNSFGSLIYSGNLSGPIGKKGWGYSLSVHETYDRGNGVNRMYVPWNDRCEMIKAGIAKKYKNGIVKLLYKHASQSTQYSSYWPLVNDGAGKYSNLPGFEAGVDSYVLANGMIPYRDAFSGESKVLNLADKKNTYTKTDAVYLMGDHTFSNGWKMTYSTMFQHSVAPFSIQFPISLGTSTTNGTGAALYYLHGSSTPYVGGVQMVNNQFKSPTTANSEFTRIELTKKLGSHSLRIGLTNIYYNNLGEQTNYGLYYQTISANPTLLDFKYGGFAMTDANGNFPTSQFKKGEFTKGWQNKTAIYVSDDARLTPWLTAGIGARFENYSETETTSPYTNDFIYGVTNTPRDLMTTKFKNKLNKAFIGNFVANVTPDFGVIGDASYNDFYNKFYTAPTGSTTGYTTQSNLNQIAITNFGAGLFYNMGDKFQITSKVGIIKKTNYTTTLAVYNPANPSQSTTVYPVYYDIKTFGWTTDMVVSPFKNFNLHYLITIQDPKFDNYKVNAFNTTFDYSSQSVPGISKMLMEIDPSYQLSPDLRLWVSMRYFGKQYGNLSNSFEYNPWWESFCGVDYRVSSKCDLKLQVVNPLGQSGIKGALQGADQITKAQALTYVGKTLVSQAMRPRTIELTASFKL
jgi:hypothetical protein